MGSMGTERSDEIQLYRTMEHECGYYPGRVAQDLVIDPQDPRLAQVFGGALEMGFRRSGGLIYRPDCAGCMACMAVRIDVHAFRPDKSLRRCKRRNADLTVSLSDAQRTEEQFALYRKYLRSRHVNGGMDDHDEVDFDQFLNGDWTESRFIEFRKDGELLAVAVTDLVDAGLSAVYTFFDPGRAARSLGTYAILTQIEIARTLDKPHVYLGYWIKGHPKMDYKRRFSGLEIFTGGQWLPMPETQRSDEQ